jgi:hypothetical protein
MSMHGFAVPEELEGAPLLHVLPSSIKKASARDIAVLKVDGASNNDSRDPPTRAASSGGGASQRPIASRTPTKTPVTGSVRGDRVRGTTKAVTSQKVSFFAFIMILYHNVICCLLGAHYSSTTIAAASKVIVKE